MILKYKVNDIRPYISWLYFYHTWGMSGKPADEKEKLRKDAEEMLDMMETRYCTHAVFELFDANSDVSRSKKAQAHQTFASPTLCDRYPAA